MTAGSPFGLRAETVCLLFNPVVIMILYCFSRLGVTNIIMRRRFAKKGLPHKKMGPSQINVWSKNFLLQTFSCRKPNDRNRLQDKDYEAIYNFSAKKGLLQEDDTFLRQPPFLSYHERSSAPKSFSAASTIFLTEASTSSSVSVLSFDWKSIVKARLFMPCLTCLPV